MAFTFIWPAGGDHNWYTDHNWWQGSSTATLHKLVAVISWPPSPQLHRALAWVAYYTLKPCVIVKLIICNSFHWCTAQPVMFVTPVKFVTCILWQYSRVFTVQFLINQWKQLLLKPRFGSIYVRSRKWICVVVVDQFTPVYLFTPTPKFIQNNHSLTINYKCKWCIWRLSMMW